MIQPKTLIVGLGNPLMSDEGLGITIIEKLERDFKLPSHIFLLDGGTAGYALIDYVKGFEKIIIIDAVKGGRTAGTIYRFTSEEVISQPALKLSGHQIDLAEVLNLAEKLGELPETILIGVEPDKLDYSLELTPKVAASVDSVITTILDEIEVTQ